MSRPFALLSILALHLFWACGAPQQEGTPEVKETSASLPGDGASPAAQETEEQVETAPSVGDSLLGEALPPTRMARSQAEEFERALSEAQSDLEESPDSLDAWIWVGRRLGYLGRMREAIAHFTQALERFPNEPRLLRHRGHRYLSVRDLDRALLDLSTAAEKLEGKEDRVEQDGLPNAAGEPRSTLKGNVWYHLGLTHFVRGEHSRAYSAFSEALTLATNDDARVSSMYWATLSLMRLELYPDMAAVLAGLPAEPDVIENQDYLTLVRLFRQEIPPEEVLQGSGLQFATLGFGVAQYHLGRTAIEFERATQAETVDPNDIYLRILDESPWAAFGHLAAEAELSRL
ncbi:MAG: tetratricopeptide repeat protein [Planctomycetota bacterium]